MGCVEVICGSMHSPELPVTLSQIPLWMIVWYGRPRWTVSDARFARVPQDAFKNGNRDLCDLTEKQTVDL